MAATVIQNTAAVRIIWNYGGNAYAVNVYHGIMTGAFPSISQDSANGLAASVKSAWDASTMKPLIYSAIVPATVGVRSLDTPNQPEYLASTGATGSSNSTDPLPLQTALCVTLRTALAGASYRGRTYITGFTEGNGVGGAATGTVGTACVDWITRLQSAMGSNGLNMSVASRKTGQSKAVTAIVVRNTQWDTQRRRAGAARI